MSALFALLVCALFVAGVAYSAWRVHTLFELEFVDGKLSHARGRLPRGLLNDVLQVAHANQSARIVIRCVVEQGKARVVTRGSIGPDSVQQLRNLVGLWPLQRLRSAPKIAVG